MIRGLLISAIAANEVAAHLRSNKASKDGVASADYHTCFMEADPDTESGGAKGRSYRGLVSRTVSGRSCQKWTANHPWVGAVAIVPTPDVHETVGGVETTNWGNGVGNHNYCRNPDSSEAQPWCFTMDPQKEKELCDIPKCSPHPRDFTDEAQSLSTDVAATDCDCADQLYGSTLTTRKTAVKLTLIAGKKESKKCDCHPR